MEGKHSRVNEPVAAGDPATVSPRQARAWFDTVLNPVIEGLRIQHGHLERRAWTWQFRTKRFEVIVGAHSYIDVRFWPNYDFLWSREPTVQDLLTSYDAQVEVMRAAFEHVHYQLVLQSDLPSEYERLTSPTKLAEYDATTARLFGAYPEQDHVAYLAQLIINQTPELPEYYPVHPLWNRERERLLRQLEHPAVSVAYKRGEDAALELLTLNRQTLDWLMRFRIRIANESGEPPVAMGHPNE